MPTVYQTPGVYINEVPAASKPIEGVATSVAAFIGLAPEGPVNTPKRITSWVEFVRIFGTKDPASKSGPFLEGAYLAHAVQGFYVNGGQICWVVRVGTDLHGGVAQKALPSAENPAAFTLIRKPQESDLDAKGEPKPADDLADISVKIEEENPSDEKSPDAKTFTMTVTSTEAGVEPESFTGLSAYPGAKYMPAVVNAGSTLVTIEETAAALPFAQRVPTAGTYELAPPSPDVPTPTSSDLTGDEAQRTGLGGLSGTQEITMVCIPDLMSLRQNDTDIRAAQTALVSFCTTGQIKRMAILDPPPGLDQQEILDWRNDANTQNSAFATLYWPWLEVRDPISGGKIAIPPCGHVAGVWAGTDNRRGVHKAPANEAVGGIVGLSAEVNDAGQGELNKQGINCIRSFTGGRGTRIWGARTLSVQTEPEWKYINVRRLFNFVSASLLNGTQWAVFEPNDEFLWSQMRTSVGNFLTGLWRTGALFGATPDQAFFVKCDSATNPPDAIEAGQVTIQVGIAPVKPAEFVIFQISQYQVGQS